MRPKIFAPISIILGLIGIAGVALISSNHSACQSDLVYSVNEQLCHTDSILYVISWAFIGVAVIMVLGQFVTVLSRFSTATKARSPALPLTPQSGQGPRFCSKCGNALVGAAKFCAACGEPTEVSQV